MRKPFSGLALALVCLLTGAACGPVALAASGPIRNVTTGQSFDGLQDALSSARDGDAIEVSGGPYVGNFLIERTMVPMAITTTISMKRRRALPTQTATAFPRPGAPLTAEPRSTTIRSMRPRWQGFPPRHDCDPKASGAP